MVSSASEIFYLNTQQQTWTSPAGTVTRTNYGNYESMSGVIAPAGVSSITLQFTSFQTEQNYDIVIVKSCTAIDCLQSTVLGQYSGSSIPSPVTSNTGVMLIQWTSDSIVTRSGWSASWSSVMIVGGLLSRFLSTSFQVAGCPSLTAGSFRDATFKQISDPCPFFPPPLYLSGLCMQWFTMLNRVVWAQG